MNKKSFKLGQLTIEEGGGVFVIAEAGVNHNQDLELALKLVDIAADAGADAVKFQTFEAEQVVAEDVPMAGYQAVNTGSSQSQRQMLRRVSLPQHFYPLILERCRKRDIIFLSTPHGSKPAVDFLVKLGVAAIKISSGDMTDYLLLDYVAATGLPVIISTGMSNLEEVKAAVERLKQKGSRQIVVLHCTTNYPCPPEETNLAAMRTLMKELPVPVGFSDHTEGDTAAILAASMGMAVYEFHITADKKLPGPDHLASADPEEAKRRVAAIRSVTVYLGTGEKKPTVSEEVVMKPSVRRSVVAARDLPGGYVITADDLEALRPGNGVPAKDYELFIGKKLKQAVGKDHFLQPTEVE